MSEPLPEYDAGRPARWATSTITRPGPASAWNSPQAIWREAATAALGHLADWGLIEPGDVVRLEGTTRVEGDIIEATACVTVERDTAAPRLSLVIAAEFYHANGLEVPAP